MIDNQILIPDGVKDYVPFDYSRKSDIIKKIEHTFLKYNYKQVETPMFEFIEVFDGKGSVSKNQMYKFVDRNGDILALRPDLTPPICRMVSSSNLYKNTPLRLCYTGSTFRHNESYQGKLREFTQTGAELMGTNSKQSTIEILDMAINSLLVVGLKNFRIDISQTKFFEGLIEESYLSKPEVAQIQKYLIDKNFVAVSEMAQTAQMPNKIRDFLCNISAFIGKTDVLENAKNYVINKKSRNALDELLEIYNTLNNYSLDKYINFDLSMIGSLDYYTGIIFSGYTHGTGFSILDGGQYDNLMKLFGRNISSIGFSIKINNIMQASEYQDLINTTSNKTIYFVGFNTSNMLYYDITKKLRDNDFIVESSLIGNDLDKNIDLAKSKNYKHILFLNKENLLELIRIDTLDRQILSSTELVNEIIRLERL